MERLVWGGYGCLPNCRGCRHCSRSSPLCSPPVMTFREGLRAPCVSEDAFRLTCRKGTNSLISVRTLQSGEFEAGLPTSTASLTVQPVGSRSNQRLVLHGSPRRRDVHCCRSLTCPVKAICRLSVARHLIQPIRSHAELRALPGRMFMRCSVFTRSDEACAGAREDSRLGALTLNPGLVSLAYFRPPRTLACTRSL